MTSPGRRLRTIAGAESFVSPGENADVVPGFVGAGGGAENFSTMRFGNGVDQYLAIFGGNSDCGGRRGLFSGGWHAVHSMVRQILLSRPL